MIGYYKISAIGTDHIEKADGICQDYSDVIQLQNGYTVAAIADGLGSASKSDIGSKVAVNSFLDYIDSHIVTKNNDKFYIELISQAYHEAYSNVMKTAKDMKINFSEFNTTLTTAIYDGKTLYYGQCGDGGIVVLTNDGDFDCATQVKKGEAFNETFPLLGGADNWSFGKYNEKVCAITLLTDGIFDIVLHPLLANQQQKINIPFIRRFMDRNILKANDTEDFHNLQKSIYKFVSGNGIPGVTDDKTIVGLINTEIFPKVKDNEYYKEPDWDKLNKDMKQKLREGIIENTKVDDKPTDEVIYKKPSTDWISDYINKLKRLTYINRRLRQIVLIELAIILILLIICIVCFVSLIINSNSSEKENNSTSVSIAESTEKIDNNTKSSTTTTTTTTIPKNNSEESSDNSDTTSSIIDSHLSNEDSTQSA